jgi:hypothetical protein
MLTEVMEHFGLRQELHAAGFYETEHHRQIIKDIRATVGGGRHRRQRQNDAASPPAG